MIPQKEDVITSFGFSMVKLQLRYLLNCVNRFVLFLNYFVASYTTITDVPSIP